MRNLEERISDIKEILSEAMKDCKRSLSIIEKNIKEGVFDKPSYGEAKVIEERVNNFEAIAEEEVVKTIARFQPMAVNLRFLVSVIKMGISLERMNDLSINILKVMKHSENISLYKKSTMEDMLFKVQHMFDLLLKAYYEEKISFAYLIIGLDEEVNAFKSDIIENLKSGTPEKESLEILFIFQHLERIGDLIKNLAESIVYVYNGIDIRRSGEIIMEEKKVKTKK